MAGKLERLMAEFDFGRMDALVADERTATGALAA